MTDAQNNATAAAIRIAEQIEQEWQEGKHGPQPTAFKISRTAAYRALVEQEERLAALTAELEEVKGKLVMMEKFLRDFKTSWRLECVCHLLTNSQECESCSIEETLQALSPDIQRYREEIERDTLDNAIKEVERIISKKMLRLGVVYHENETAYIVPMVEMVEEIKQSLLPKQKEVSDEH